MFFNAIEAKYNDLCFLSIRLFMGNMTPAIMHLYSSWYSYLSLQKLDVNTQSQKQCLTKSAWQGASLNVKCTCVSIWLSDLMLRLMRQEQAHQVEEMLAFQTWSPVLKISFTLSETAPVVSYPLFLTLHPWFSWPWLIRGRWNSTNVTNQNRKVLIMKEEAEEIFQNHIPSPKTSSWKVVISCSWPFLLCSIS